MNNKIIDTHGHILKSGYGNNLEKVINKINEEEIVVVNIPLGVKSSIEVIELHKKYKFLLPTVGIHPDFINRFKEEDLKIIEELITDDVVAIAEIGLDYHRKNDIEDKRLQKHIFESQIKIAQKYNLPIVIHVLDAHDDLIEIIKNYPKQKFLMHCWSGSIKHTKELLDFSNNIYFAFGGEITTKQLKKHRSWEVPDLMKKTIRLIPENRLLFETDCPGLIPDPYRAKGEETNYPWYIKDILKFVSKELNIEYIELLKLGNKNAMEFYELDNITF